MAEINRYSEITPAVAALADHAVDSSTIDPALYKQYDVKRGLRDLNGDGVLAGLTRISDIRSFATFDGEKLPCEGELYYRGYNIYDLVRGFLRDKRLGYEEVAYLLLFGRLPNAGELGEFNTILAGYRTLPTCFVRDIIM